MNRPLRLIGFSLSCFTVTMALSAQLSARPTISVAPHVEEAAFKLDKPAKARVGRLADLRRPAARPANEKLA